MLGNKNVKYFVFGIYCLSVLIGQSLFVFIPALQVMRIFSIFLFIFFILYPAKFYVRRYLFYYCVFIFFYIVTILLSTVRNFSFFNINSFVNYFTIFLILFNLSIFLSFFDRQEMLILIKKILYLYLLICNFVAYWEMITQNHLPVSAFSDPEHKKWFRFIPTTFFRNENDYMGMYLLIFLLIFSLKKDILKEKITFLDFVLFGSLVFQSFITGARIVQLCLILYILFSFFQRKCIFFLFTICIGILILLIHFDLIKNLLSETFSNHGSNEIRKNLYILALRTLVARDSTMFLGFGMTGAVDYYRNVDSTLFRGGIEAPHNYLFELILESGLFFASCFLFFTMYIFIKLRKKKYNSLSLLTLLFFFILCAPASSSFLWPQHIVLLIIFYCANFSEKIVSVKKQYKSGCFPKYIFRYR